ncbi:dehydrogenase [Actinocatenispora thailandica]|uniref:Dehydrogenase n=1 Tax=Actinocatenispora thailandica TaxID=227318 RepID=A0A7R7DPD7_9ACTN|nr:2-hydroxyacid dehydrogenase [Actinocatenispora thailandica]BCJ35195.1 dehydrogenase [Actinocatenispora thailandica]
MAEHVLVPWQLTDGGDGWPATLRVDVWDGQGAPPDVSDVSFYVLPYGVSSARGLVTAMPRLRVLQALTAGYEQLLPLLRPGLTLCNGRGLHDASTAEHALGLVLAAQRDLPTWVDDQRERRWEPHYTRSLADSRVLIVGYGSIGTALERRLLACEASVVRVARSARPETRVHGVAELPALLPKADIVVLILPDNESTERLFDATAMAALPDGALVVNVGRGRTLDTEALAAETGRGRLRAALDVTDPEPLPAGHPLWSHPGVLITPHVAGGSATFYPRARRLIGDQLHRFVTGAPLRNVVREG